ncbi:GerAB/ArcD/ProY family transporter [Paenibacillus sp. SI8]|uniref:GerAB/ArcD/ProY family transporter n=1 Tax=unclassified Paenibacillus TaxID=185978 RepID=UPI0034650502
MKYQRISHLQFFFIQSLASIDMISLRFPAHAIQTMDQHAWMIVVIAFFIAMFNLIVALQLLKRHPNENLIEISRRYLGRWIGGLYALFVSAESFLLGILMFWENWSFVSYVQLKSTPVSIIAIFFMLVITYLLLSGLEGWSRLVQLLGFFMLASIPLLNLPQLSNADFARLLPLTDLDVSKLNSTLSIHGMLMFKGVLAVYFLRPHVEDNGRIYRISLFALLLAFIQVLPTFILPIAVFGARTAAQFSFPYAESMETVPLYLLPIEKISFMAPMFFLFLLVIMMVISFYCCAQSIRTWMGIKNERLIYVSITLVAIAILVWPVSLPQILKVYPYWTYGYLFIFIIPPIYMWIAGFFRRKVGAAH